MTRPQPTANCAWCGEEFTPPPSARHKRFCSARHREQWHSARVAEAKRLLAATEDAKVDAEADRLGLDSL